VSSGRFSLAGNRRKYNSRPRGIDRATQRHLSVAHFYVHSQQRAHTELDWAQPVGGGLQRRYVVDGEEGIVGLAEADLRPLELLLDKAVAVEVVGGLEREEENTGTRMLTASSVGRQFQPRAVVSHDVLGIMARPGAQPQFD
jgi:hypothetical protein